MKKKLINNKLFYFFYKILKIYRNNNPSYHYGEFGEDIFINRIFKSIRSGKYVDVGCYHPYKGSLTVDLYKKGWSGINIDISKTSIDLFNLIRTRDTNLNIAVSNFDGDTNYYENSVINQQNSLIKSNDSQKVVKIKCKKLNTILEENNLNKFEYLNIDVEGNELNVVKGLDLAKYTPNLITIENNNLLIEDYIKSETYNLLKEMNYVFIGKSGVTNFFLIKKLSQNFLNLIKI